MVATSIFYTVVGGVHSGRPPPQKKAASLHP